ncbi:metallophosphoesterase [bacterium]|nr:metallophosphoesterase [bacterium]
MKKTMILFLVVTAMIAGVDRGPIISSEDPSSAFYINFTTDNSCITQIFYRILPSGSWVEVTDITASSDHNIRIDILPGYEHEYFVRADGDSLGPYKFWTAPRTGSRQDFHFCAYGDTRTGMVAHWVVIDHVMTCDPMFMVHTGDMIEDGEDTGQWDDYFAELCEWHDIARSVPFFYAMGNHDDESPYFYSALTLPKNNPDSSEAYSSFDWGRIHFFSMNSEVDYDSASPQYNFIVNDLAEASIDIRYDFIIGLVHRPFYSSGYHGREEDLADALEPLLIEYGVDLVLQGHDHMYERVSPQSGVYYVVTGGGGAPPSPIVLWHDYTAFGYNLYHHLHFLYSAAEAKLSMYMHNYLNNVVDSLILFSSPLDVKDIAKPQTARLSAHPSPFNKACLIETKGDLQINIRDISGRLIVRGSGPCFLWEPSGEISTGLYLISVTDGEAKKSSIGRIVYLK